MSKYITIPCYSLSPRTLTLYEIIESLDGFRSSSKGWENLNDNENKTGELSEHARKRLSRALNYMFYLTKEKEIIGRHIKAKIQNYETNYEKGAKHKKPVNYKLAFITLTLPAKQFHTDNEIKSKGLNHFLTILRRKFHVNMYIWKAEKQENGNIHFHILINRYIHWKEIRENWNQILAKLGYISAYQKNMKNYFREGFRLSENPKDKRSREQQKKAYETGKKENWTNPNSTDIHALYKVKNVPAYIAKYIAKGVTKTNRIQNIQKLNHENEKIQKRLDEIEKEIFLYDEANQTAKRLSEEKVQLEEKLKNNSNELQKLLKLGVQGRIWGCSSNLSKCKNFNTSESWRNIPDIETVVEKSKAKFTTQIGSRSITTYLFDIEKTPKLKANLDFHLQTLLNPESPPLL